MVERDTQITNSILIVIRKSRTTLSWAKDIPWPIRTFFCETREKLTDKYSLIHRTCNQQNARTKKKLPGFAIVNFTKIVFCSGIQLDKKTCQIRSYSQEMQLKPLFWKFII